MKKRLVSFVSGCVTAVALSNVGLAQQNLGVETRAATKPAIDRADAMQSSLQIVMEDGTSVPAELQVVATGACAVTRIFGNGRVLFGRAGPPPNDNAGPQSVGATEQPQPAADGNVTYGPLKLPNVGEDGRPRGCTALVMAPGVRSQHVALTSDSSVVLKRLGEHEGSTISITVLQATPEAKKAYAKGAEAMRKKKYAEARKHFEQAVRIYPMYAPAWSELGDALIMSGKQEEARVALQEAIKSDEVYLKPLVQLAGLEADTQHWQECVRAADAAIALKAVEFPGAYYYRALAHLQAREWDGAVQLSVQAIQMDINMEYPRAHVVRVLALEKRGDRRAAEAALREFLTLHPPPSETEWARAYLSKLAARP